MLHDDFWLTASDAAPLYVNRWYAEQAPKAVVMVSHGMAEHGGRYARLGEALVAAGYELYAHDQRGHGKTAQRGVQGMYAEHNGWQRVVSDLANLNHHIRQQHPNVPIFLLGHSMGSYIGQAYLMHHSCSVQGAILSGSNYQPVGLYKAAATIARFERWRQGATGHPHTVRLAEPRPAGSRQVRQRPALWFPLHQPVVDRPARRFAADHPGQPPQTDRRRPAAAGDWRQP
jgi:alpha-beta hydrolase superfamily lysophospholipase